MWTFKVQFYILVQSSLFFPLKIFDVLTKSFTTCTNIYWHTQYKNLYTFYFVHRGVYKWHVVSPTPKWGLPKSVLVYILGHHIWWHPWLMDVRYHLCGFKNGHVFLPFCFFIFWPVSLSCFRHTSLSDIWIYLSLWYRHLFLLFSNSALTATAPLIS